MCIVDYMVYTRGSKDDYDRWARTVGDEGWSWDALFPYMLKVRCTLHYMLPFPSYFKGPLRWKHLLNPSTIEVHQAKLIPSSTGIPVRHDGLEVELPDHIYRTCEH